MQKTRNIVASTALKAKGSTVVAVKTILKDMSVSDNRVQRLIAKIDDAELTNKTLKKTDIEGMEPEATRIEANGKAIDALVGN